MKKLIGLYNPIVVDLTPVQINHKQPLIVLRALSEKLIPINFGFKTEPDAMGRLKKLKFKKQNIINHAPHFFP